MSKTSRAAQFPPTASPAGSLSAPNQILPDRDQRQGQWSWHRGADRYARAGGATRRRRLPCLSDAGGGVRQFTAWDDTDEGRHIFIAVARYLAAHSPTERAALQTADIARRLMRGGELHQEVGSS